MSATAEKVEHASARHECALCRATAVYTEKHGMSYCEEHWRVVHPQRLRRLVRALRGTSASSRA